jgi:hypothetical protein
MRVNLVLPVYPPSLSTLVSGRYTQACTWTGVEEKEVPVPQGRRDAPRCSVGANSRFNTHRYSQANIDSYPTPRAVSCPD